MFTCSFGGDKSIEFILMRLDCTIKVGCHISYCEIWNRKIQGNVGNEISLIFLHLLFNINLFTNAVCVLFFSLYTE